MKLKRQKWELRACSSKRYRLQVELLKIYMPGQKYELEVDLLRFQSPQLLTRAK